MNLEKNIEQKGFTLIELMIVVAIIGILASIAIPQFSTFRIKAYNSSALSDIHGARLTEEALYTDYQSYGGGSKTNSTADATVKVLLASTGGSFIGTKTAGTGMPITISNNVKLVAVAEAAADPANSIYATTATMTAKHKEGDKLYAAETDQTGLFQKPSTAGTNLTTAVAVAATTIAATGAQVADATAAGFIKMK